MDTPIEPFSQISTNCLRNRTARLPGATSAIFSGNFSKYIAYFVMANISTPRTHFQGLFLVCQGQFLCPFNGKMGILWAKWPFYAYLGKRHVLHCATCTNVEAASILASRKMVRNIDHQSNFFLAMESIYRYLPKRYCARCT